jgi:D-glycero-alpha-D-manno-heptose 1-phosphate guanylyltransferase
MNPLDVIILAGGLGTRLQQTVPGLPKPLAPINEKPFLDILLTFLNRWDFIKTVVIAVGYMADKVIQRYKDTDLYNFEINFSIEEKLLGTGGAIKQALQHTATYDVLCLNGDSFIEIDLLDLYKTYMKKVPMMMMAVRKVENASRYGSVKLDDNKRIIFFQEKGAWGSALEDSRGYINAGMYLFKKTLFDDVNDGHVISLEKELLPEFIKQNVYAYPAHGKFIDIGTPESYVKASTYLKEVS